MDFIKTCNNFLTFLQKHEEGVASTVAIGCTALSGVVAVAFFKQPLDLQAPAVLMEAIFGTGAVVFGTSVATRQMSRRDKTPDFREEPCIALPTIQASFEVQGWGAVIPSYFSNNVNVLAKRLAGATKTRFSPEFFAVTSEQKSRLAEIKKGSTPTMNDDLLLADYYSAKRLEVRLKKMQTPATIVQLPPDFSSYDYNGESPIKMGEAGNLLIVLLAPEQVQSKIAHAQIMTPNRESQISYRTALRSATCQS